MSDFKEKPLSDLLTSVAADTMTLEDYTKAVYLAEVQAMNDFTPDRDRLIWPDPVRPMWRN